MEHVRGLWREGFLVGRGRAVLLSVLVDDPFSFGCVTVIQVDVTGVHCFCCVGVDLAQLVWLGYRASRK